MREHIRRIISEAQRSQERISLDGREDPALRLASETIRLARLAASTHMILSARMTSGPASPSRHLLETGGHST